MRRDTGTDQLLCDVDAGVATVTFNRPEKRNALGDIVSPALRATLLALDQDPEVRAVVLTGAGAAFCAGGDISGMGSGRDGPPPPVDEAARELFRRQETLTLRLFELSKPTIAALPGPAAGAGMSIALACDIRIAAERAFLAPGFVNVALPGDYGGSWLLTRLIGPARAKQYYFTGQRMMSADALALGVFNEVVADDALAARAAELARQIADGPPAAIRAMKATINAGQDTDLRAVLALEAHATVRCARTADHTEGVAAFLEKRKPVFTGR